MNCQPVLPLYVLVLAAASPIAAMAQEAETPASEVAPSPDVNAMIHSQRWEVMRVTPPPIVNTVIVDGTIQDAWALWTDPERMPEFMGFEADIQARPGGAYRVTFVRGAETPLARGNDGRILAVEPYRMLSFSWMTPMHMSDLTGQSTVVTLYFTPLDDGERVQVDLINTGYGQGAGWREAYNYNLGGWDRVLSHFQFAMEVGPIDWEQGALDLRRDGTLPMWREYKRKVLAGDDPLARD